jgi:hypothetical protein
MPDFNVNLPNDAPAWAGAIFAQMQHITEQLDHLEKKIDALSARVTALEIKTAQAAPAAAAPSAITAPAEDGEPAVAIQPGRVRVSKVLAWGAAALAGLGGAIAWLWVNLGIHVTLGGPK